jgi:uncharacterized protein (UPF0335 family)
MSLKFVRDKKIRRTIVRCKNERESQLEETVNILPLSLIFMGQTEQNRDNFGVSNILRQREMSLKYFRDKKIRRTIVRCKNERESQSEETVNILPLSSIFMGQTEQDRVNPGVYILLKQREMSLKSFWDKKIRRTIVRCKNEYKSQLEETVNILPLSSIFMGQTEQDEDNPSVYKNLK